MKSQDELPIIRAWYEFLIWIIPKIGKFPRDLRFTLGERLEQRILAVLELLIRARYDKHRLDLLQEANTELDVILYLLRAAHDLKALPTKAYGDASGKLLEVGKQLGGWKRTSEPPNVDQE
ncbi:MAG: diversity-generating retroelement protein Avd [Planctomycetaceae bacterium]|nr:diversity-generating retroelement protein Avd [Planctomycetaceae bacterium]